ncbi:subtilisin-like protein [Lactarius psammicola]|nr:subtilisin-like protein [Lactarius psammicola]
MRYHCIFVLSVLTFAPLGGLATILTPRWEEMRSKHSWHAVPEDWECLDHPLNDTTIDLYVALRPHRKNALVDALYDVSTPGRPKYGAHLSKEQVAELVAPHPDTLGLVHSWLEYRGIPSSSVSVTRGALQARPDNETIVRTIGYALPTALHGHQKPRKRFSGAAVGPVEAKTGELVTVPSSRNDNRDVASTPSILSWLYSTWAYSPTATDRDMLGLVGFLWEYPSPKDLYLYMSKYRPNGARAIFTVVLVHGGVLDLSGLGSEANLDMQYAQVPAAGRRAKRTGTPPGSDTLDKWSVPQTISVSYDNGEWLYIREYAEYVCDLFARLGARGVSVLFAGLDKGVSGSGFSDYFERPIYQQQTGPPSSRTLATSIRACPSAASGNGIPDIAAQVTDLRIFLDGGEIPASSTSDSSPVSVFLPSLISADKEEAGTLLVVEEVEDLLVDQAVEALLEDPWLEDIISLLEEPLAQLSWTSLQEHSQQYSTGTENKLTHLCQGLSRDLGATCTAKGY